MNPPARRSTGLAARCMSGFAPAIVHVASRSLWCRGPRPLPALAWNRDVEGKKRVLSHSRRCVHVACSIKSAQSSSASISVSAAQHASSADITVDVGPTPTATSPAAAAAVRLTQHQVQAGQSTTTAPANDGSIHKNNNHQHLGPGPQRTRLRLSSAAAGNASRPLSPLSSASFSHLATPTSPAHSSPTLASRHQPRRNTHQLHYNSRRRPNHNRQDQHARSANLLHDYDYDHDAALVATARCALLQVAHARRRVRSTTSIMGCPSQQTRAHGNHGHSHSHGLGHHHHHDNSYLISANKNDSGVRITRIGLLSNLGMAVAKFAGGWAFNSKAMTADAWHSIADLASDILTLATVSWSLKPPTDRFPMGFGKVESLGSLGVSGMLLFGGFYMGWESAISLYTHFNPEAAHSILEHFGGHGHGHGHSHSHSAASLGIPSIHAAWLAAGTILIKEWLYRATMKIARERKSSVLASNAVHHRIDSLTGIVTLAVILGANVLEHAAWLDPVGGLLISMMVINAGLQNTKAALFELVDQSIDEEMKSSLRKQTYKALANVVNGHEAELGEVSGIKSGQNYLIDLEMTVPGSWTVESVRQLEDEVRTQVGSKVRGVRRVRVRFVSREKPVNEKFDEFIPGSVHVEADPEPKENGDAGEEKDSTGEHNHRH